MKHTMLIVSALALLSHGTYCEAAEYTEVQPQKVQRRTSYMRDIADLTLGGLLMTTAGMSGYASYQLGRDTYQQTTGLKGIIHDANKTVMSFFNKHVAPQNRYLARYGLAGGLGTLALTTGATGLNLIARGFVNMARKMNQSDDDAGLKVKTYTFNIKH